MTKPRLATSAPSWIAALALSSTLAAGCIFTSTRPGDAGTNGAGTASAAAASATPTVEPTAVASADAATEPTADPGAAGTAVVSLEPPPCTTAPPALKPPEAKIVLIDAGQEPRRTLRYKPRPGLRRAVTYELTSSVTSKDGEQVREQQGMGFALTIDGKIGKPDKGKDDEIRWEFKTTKLEVPELPGMPAKFNKAIREQLSAWEKAKGTVLLDTRGMTQDVKLDGVDSRAMGKVHDIRVALEQTANPLPEEPIGVGAKWEVVTVVDTGLVLRGHTVFELVALDGDRGTVRFSIEQKSDPTPGPAICPAPNVVMQPISWNATGTGERKFHLGELLAGAYQTKLVVRNVSRSWVTENGQVQMGDATVDVNLETKMTAK